MNNNEILTKENISLKNQLLYLGREFNGMKTIEKK